MHPPGKSRLMARAGLATAAVLLSAPVLSATAMAAPSTPGQLPAASHGTGAASAATPKPVPWPAGSSVKPGAPVRPTTASTPRPANHPTARGCPEPTKAGFAECLAVKRTDVRAHKGLFAAASSAAAFAPGGYGPADLQSAYGLPSATAGGGQTVAIVDAFDDPNAEADLRVYRAQYGLPVCDTANGCFTKVAQDGSTSYPPPDNGWALEISLDLDMVSAICPNCHILLVEANDNQTVNLGASVNEAVALGAKFVSNSYAGGEDPSELTLDSSYYNHPGVAITASSGDSGFGPLYPASSQYVTAVGGTTLIPDSGTSRGWSETAWSGAGSGCSAFEPKPSWQADTGCANRSDADVSAVADPNTGVATYDTYINSGWGVTGGTSVSSPVIASTYALAGVPAAGSYPSSYLYADAAALNDVASGTNGVCAPAYLCTSGPGYDGPTGIGTPDGVAAFSTGPRGTVSGTVTDRATGKPVAGAQVDVGSQPTTTSSSGAYTLTIPAGSYTLTVSDFGYQTKTVTGIQVTSGKTTAKNVTLAAAPSATISGAVTDSSGHGWPLYAKVSVAGTPLSTYTNPATGKYSVTVPDNAAYTLTVDAAYPGYAQATQAVSVAAGNLTQNIGVPVNSATCGAAGYQFNFAGHTESFDGAGLPAGWSIVNTPDSAGSWEFDDPTGLTNNTGGSGNFAVAFSEIPVIHLDTELVSPVFDLSQDTSPIVQFNSDLRGFVSDNDSVDVTTDGGQTWTTVFLSQGFPGKAGPDLESIPLPMAAGQPKVQVRFHYVSTFGDWWEVDNVFVGNRTCDPVPGGMVEGVVTDGNTGAGVNGVTVTSAATPAQTATTAPTTGDPGIGDGFYHMFLPAAGSQQFTATMKAYTAVTKSVNVAADAATALNLSLPAGQLSVSAGTVNITAPMGASATKNLTFKNTGGAPLSVKLFPGARGFSIAGQPAGGAPLQRVHGTFSPLSVALTKKLTGSAAQPAAQPQAAPWTAIANYPTPIAENAAATDTSTGLVYSVGGAIGSTITNAGYVYNPASQLWTALPSMNFVREHAMAAFINGKLYVAGGYDSNGNPVAQAESYNPATHTWAILASMPVPFAAGGVTTLGGKMYIVGGCGSANCGRSALQIYDPSTNTWSLGADYPDTTSWEGCGAINNDIYCAGGVVASSFFETLTTAEGFAYDPAANTWSPIAPVPTDMWGAGYAAANGQLLLSGGIVNGDSTLTNQGFAYNPATDSWTGLPNSNYVNFGGASACGLYRIGGFNGGNLPVNTAEQLPGYSACGGAQAPWLSASQTSFTLSPGAQTTVTLTAKAGDPSVTQPGAYNAGLAVTDSTPYQTSPVGVTLTATPPRTWGKVAGTVTGTTCAGATGPIPGATVQVNSAGPSFTLGTGVKGTYALWLDARNGPVTLIVSKDGWQPQARTVKIAKGATKTANFTLKPAC
jgi:N-acetylneuraminic acid mutarotase